MSGGALDLKDHTGPPSVAQEAEKKKKARLQVLGPKLTMLLRLCPSYDVLLGSARCSRPVG
ncbi:hypothetical protein EYF80_008441 [Liparis tanakae]|uniref:Uncharacterized protein n=1 Tax=Liparis tanakae TaxID=230148 RepID=A0A4Z2IU12_9TELE|nr:hypothetical protein EYF80_008441 [Liparis tanakae]